MDTNGYYFVHITSTPEDTTITTFYNKKTRCHHMCQVVLPLCTVWALSIANSTLLNWPIVSLLILFYFILFSNLFCILVHDYTLCFFGSPCCSVSYCNYIFIWLYYIVIHFMFFLQPDKWIFRFQAISPKFVTFYQFTFNYMDLLIFSLSIRSWWASMNIDLHKTHLPLHRPWCYSLHSH